jgi:hypothetical protein
MLSLSISYPYLIKFPNFADNSQEGMKHQMGGWNSGPTGHDFPDNSNIYFSFFLPWEPDPDCMAGENLSGSHLKWEPLIRISPQVLTGRFSMRIGMKTSAGFQPVGENRPTLVLIAQ